MHHLLPAEAHRDLIAGAHVCRHLAGCWNSVSSHQFREKTAIRTGKGGLKGLTLSSELVTEWIDSFPVSAYLSDAMEQLYSYEVHCSPSPSKHKDEGDKRRKLDSGDRQMIATELARHSHPLEVESAVLYNIVNGQIAPRNVNVEDALVIGEKIATSFRNSLPFDFHAKISSQVKTMEQLKRGVKVGDNTVFDLEAIFIRLLLVGQQRQLQLEPSFQ